MLANLEDALQLSSDWIAIKEAALKWLRLQKVNLVRDILIRARVYTDGQGTVHKNTGDIDRQLALIEAWPAGAPPRQPCGDLIIKSTPVVVDGLTWHVVEVEEIKRTGIGVRMFDRSRREPHTVVLRTTTGEVL